MNMWSIVDCIMEELPTYSNKHDTCTNH